MTGKVLTAAFFSGAVLWPIAVVQSISGLYTVCALITFLIFVSLYVSSDMVSFGNGIRMVRHKVTEGIPLIGIVFLAPALGFVLLLSVMFALMGIFSRNREAAQVRWALLIDWFSDGAPVTA